MGRGDSGMCCVTSLFIPSNLSGQGDWGNLIIFMIN